MKNIEITIPGEIVDYNELTPADADLVEQARQATFRSYAPYSHFCVGAAIRLDDGTVVTGANHENATYPSGTCAERSACYYAHAQYPEKSFETIAIAARDVNGNFTDEVTAPCGACRQALLEYETLAGRNVRVLLAGADKIYILPSVRSLLPLAFVKFRD